MCLIQTGSTMHDVAFASLPYTLEVYTFELVDLNVHRHAAMCDNRQCAFYFILNRQCAIVGLLNIDVSNEFVVVAVVVVVVVDDDASCLCLCV